MSQKTYSAEGDIDQIVLSHFFAGAGDGRIFVDVGAASPDFLSISSRFRKSGWRVIAVEPNPAFCDLYRQRGLEVIQCACGNRDEENVDFFVVDSHGTEYAGGNVSFESFSSLGIKDSYRALKPKLDTKKIKVRLCKLETLMKEIAPEVKRIDVISIDVEGWELEVLEGVNLKKYRPRVIILENLFTSNDYHRRLADWGYYRWKTIAPNEIYLPLSLYGRLLNFARALRRFFRKKV